jgi:CRP/FNR family transcriptional regulator, cyclic AMP receptor protein
LDISQLKRIPLFAGVPDEALTKLAPFATSEEWPEGKRIVAEGGYSNQFYAIEEGTAKVERGQERSATVTSTSPIKLIKIESWELARMRRSMPEVVEELRRTVEERAG